MSIVNLSKRIQQVRVWNRDHPVGTIVTFTRNNMFHDMKTISAAAIHPDIRTGIPCVRVEVGWYILLGDISFDKKG